MDPISRAVVPALGALLGFGQPSHPPPHRPAASIEAPIPRDKPAPEAHRVAGEEPSPAEGAAAASDKAWVALQDQTSKPVPKDDKLLVDVEPPLTARMAALDRPPHADRMASVLAAPKPVPPTPAPTIAAVPPVVPPASEAPVTGLRPAAEDKGRLIIPKPQEKPGAPDNADGALVTPLPREKPPVPQAALVPAEPPAAARPMTEAPLPAAKPAPDKDATSTKPGDDGTPAKLASLGPSPTAPALRGPTPADPVCMQALASLNPEFTPLPAIEVDGCGAEEPLKLSRLGVSAAVSLKPAPTVACGVATAVGQWLEDEVQQAAESELGGKVTGLRVADAYSCRTRNHVSGAPMSEHAYANAIDISAFQIDGGKWVEVKSHRKDAGEPEGRFLARIRAAACSHFTTVLGPDADPAHATHLHLDLAKRGRKGDARLCE